MQPSGLLSINGAAMTTPFLKRLLERFHVKAHLFKREGYKNAVNQFTHVRPSPPSLHSLGLTSTNSCHPFPALCLQMVVVFLGLVVWWTRIPIHGSKRAL
jgi:hypothetical protein